jgi:hypothetical protein
MLKKSKNKQGNEQEPILIDLLQAKEISILNPLNVAFANHHVRVASLS